MVIPFHLEGVSSKWFQWMEKSGSFVDWDSFIQAMQLRFGASVYDDPLGRIAKLTQLGCVEQYRAEFEDLLTLITGFLEHLFMNFFVWGLKLEIRRELLMAKPVDLADAMAKAQLSKDLNDDLLGCSKGGGFCLGWSPKSATYSPPQNQPSGSSASLGFTSANTPSSKSVKTSPVSFPNKKLTPTEIREKREKQEEDESEASLVAENTNCSELDDSLVDEGHQFQVDLYVLPIWGLDVVLGMKWLQTLSPCLHDHKAFTMEFQWQGKTVKLAGSANLGVDPLTFTQFHSLINEGDVREVCRLTAIPKVDSSQDIMNNSWEDNLPRETSTSPYSSPVLLVKKKDGTCQFYVDYRALNNVIDELLDALGGAEAAMNQMFQPCLRICVIVFFDDILVCISLTNLLKKDKFSWNTHTASAFDALKTAMTLTHVLALPDFSKDFVVETDASNVGIGGVLMQSGHPIAYFSKKLGPQFVGTSAYMRELRAIVEVVTQWRQYLIGRHFVICTDHKSLKELRPQVIQTLDQQQFLQKLLGFQFTIEYKACKENKAADASSRQHEESKSWLQAALIREFHDSPIGGHAGIQRTLLLLSANFFWVGMRQDVRNYVQACLTWQTLKYSLIAPYGLLQPLQIPERVWEDLAMYFIVGLPSSQGLTNILVVIDRFTKYAHFGALPDHYSATRVAELF
uniref:Uncharacterized protein n=1 Tax=Cannabis sativa TaxID=3483 RepID=A0A803P909_CANSA